MTEELTFKLRGMAGQVLLAAEAESPTKQDRIVTCGEFVYLLLVEFFGSCPSHLREDALTLMLNRVNIRLALNDGVNRARSN